MANIYRYTNKGIKNYQGKDYLRIPVSQSGEISTETRHIFQAILNSMELKTMDDSIQGMRLQEAIDEAEGKDLIEIGEGVFDWLKKKLEAVNREGFQLLPVLFRINGSIVREFIKEGFDKPYESKGKAKGKKEKDAASDEEAPEPSNEKE